MKTKSRLILPGGSGFLGQTLAQYFGALGWEVIILTRHPKPGTDGAREVKWDGRTVGDWARELDGAVAVVNLAGRSVDCRYHATNRRDIMQSRVDSTRVLGEAISRCATPPKVWLNSSTATIYKHSLARPWDEFGEIGATPEAKDAFSVEVATAWERVFQEAPTPHTRKVALRTSMVFGSGSVFPVLCRLARVGLGGRMASGQQYVSWIHATDFCRAIDWLIQHDEFKGPVNLAAPNPVPNAEMMATLRELCGARFGLPATQWMLELGAFFLRTETELIIKSRRVVPGRLLSGGFQFRFRQMREAMADLLGPGTPGMKRAPRA
jgi:uncharacterized protein (TIGR01777 family)